MKPLYRLRAIDFQQVVERLVLRLRYQISDAEIETVFVELSLSPPSPSECSDIRERYDKELEKTTESLCNRLSEKFAREPRLHEVSSAVTDAGYTYSRRFISDFLKLMRERNAKRWASAFIPKMKRIYLSEGETAVWKALEGTFALESAEVAPMLLRLFAVATTTGKINILEVPYLTSSVADKHLI